jgi:hypothetical protein
MSKSTRVPRASFAVTMLDDPDFISLMQDQRGRSAIAVFLTLVLTAKNCCNKGEFPDDIKLLSAQTRCPSRALSAALLLLSGVKSEPWIERKNGKIRIRNFCKWQVFNGWGGSRKGSGRKIQDEKIDYALESGLRRDRDRDSISDSSVLDLDPSPWRSYAPAIVAKYPAKHRGLKGEANEATACALARLASGEEGGPGEGVQAIDAYDVADWLTERVDAFADICKGHRYMYGLKRWMDGSGYLLSDQEWTDVMSSEDKDERPGSAAQYLKTKRKGNK